MRDSVERFRQEFYRAHRIMHKINWADPAFTPEKAFVCAICSKLAYFVIPEFEARHERSVKLIPCLTYQQTIAQGRVINFAEFAASLEIANPIVIIGRYVVIVGIPFRDVLILALRGTRPLYVSDWMIDFNGRRFRARPDDIEVIYHRGFYLALTERLEPLTTAVRDRIGHSNIPIYATGHSLGGAMAAILHSLGGRTFHESYRWEVIGQRTLDSLFGLTFGMPRYGDKRAVTQLASPFHVYNDKDIVPTVPPRWLGFADAPIEFKSVSKQPLVQGERDPSGLMNLLSRVHLARGVRHHFVERYIRRIGAGIGIY